MLYAFGFERVGVVVADLYFVNPDPAPDEPGPERGVRLEVRMLDRGDLLGSVYSAQPIGIGRPVWRADLLESVAGEPGSLDRAHHHPTFRGWEPGVRSYEPELSADPLGFVAARLADLGALLDAAGIDPADADPRDALALRRAGPEILDAVARLLDRVKAGDLAAPPVDGEALVSARIGWL